MLIGVVTFLLLLLAVLAVPVTFTFQVSWQQAFRKDIKLQWAFGLVRVQIPSSQPKTTYPEREERDGKTGQSRRASRKKQNCFALVRQKRFRRRIIRFLEDMWHAVKKHNVSLRLRVGLGDPADTGQLWAILGPLAGILANVRDASIQIEPEFIEMTLELDSSGTIRLIPLQMIYLTVALLLSPPVWQGIRQMRVAGR